MKKEDLLRALGDIREEYIEEASPSMETGHAARPEEKAEQEDRDRDIGKTPDDDSRRKAAFLARRWRRAAGAAAALLVLLIGTGVFYRMQSVKLEEAAKVQPARDEDAEDAGAGTQAVNAASGMAASGADAEAEADGPVSCEPMYDASSSGGTTTFSAPGNEGDAAEVPEAGIKAEEEPEPPLVAQSGTAYLKEEAAMEEAADAAMEEAVDGVMEEAADAAPEEDIVASGEPASAETDDTGHENAPLSDAAVEGSAVLLVSCSTLEEAAEEAGFSLEIPDAADDVTRTFEAVPGAMIGVTDLGPDGEEVLQIRKCEGDMTLPEADADYGETWTVHSGGVTVTLKGRDDSAFLAEWTRDGAWYQVLAGNEGMKRETMLGLVEQIR